MARRKFARNILTAAVLALSAACGADAPPNAEGAAALPELGLMGSIPIFWGEAGTLAGLLKGEATPHWARAQIESGFRVRPLDVLAAENLASLDFLMLAQPRPLSPEENVALDSWVRGGGQLLLFADPLLTGESRFAIGDRRRPQDTILLSPILSHWGLDLRFDEAQPAGVRVIEQADLSIPVNLPGALAPLNGTGACALRLGGVLGRCAIGEGTVTVLADAALLDLYHPHPAAPDALAALVRESFAKRGK